MSWTPWEPRETQNGSDTFPRGDACRGQLCVGRQREGSPPSSLPLTSLVAAAPSMFATDMLWLLVLGQGLEPLEGLHLHLGGGWQGSQLKWLRLCDSLCQLAAAGSCSSCRDWGLFTPPSTLLQLQTDVAKFSLKQFLIMTCTVPFCSNSCYCCEHRKPT